MNRKHYLYGMLALGMIAGCDDESPENTPEADLAADTAGGSDASSFDQSGHDMAGSTDMTMGDTAMEEDTTMEDTSMEEVVECDPAQVVEELFGFVDSVNDDEVTIDESDGLYTATIDATAGGSPATAVDYAFIYIDLDAGEVVEIDDFESISDTSWDIAFKRSEIRLNGADSGPGAWLVSVVDETSWEDFENPPDTSAEWNSDEFVSDQCEVETIGQGSAATAFGVWYDYNGETHVVSAIEDRQFALYNAGTHQVLKFHISDYQSGTYSIQWTSFF
ncbi:MAG: HmuY family protein [Myxococcales bacterium]|nr:HmuY family protein [Myxococcales bacterium]